jgi:hypothetical protein
MQAFAKTMTGKKTKPEIELSDMIDKVKPKIEDQEY